MSMNQFLSNLIDRDGNLQLYYDQSLYKKSDNGIFYLAQDDGQGNLHLYWNTTGGATPKFYVGQRHACDLVIDGTTTSNRLPTLEFRVAEGTTANANTPITEWDTLIHIDSKCLAFGLSSSTPKLTSPDPSSCTFYADADNLKYNGNDVYHVGNFSAIISGLTGDYLPLAGGTLSGPVTLIESGNFDGFIKLDIDNDKDSARVHLGNRTKVSNNTTNNNVPGIFFHTSGGGITRIDSWIKAYGGDAATNYLGNIEILGTLMSDGRAITLDNQFVHKKWVSDQFTAINTTISGINSSITNINANISNLGTDISDLETSVGTLQTNVGTLQTDLSDLETIVAGLSGNSMLPTGNKNGLVLYSKLNNTIEYDKFLNISNIVTDNIEFTSVQQVTVPFVNIFDSWQRFSHDLTNVFPANAMELTSWSYDSVTDSIKSTVNSVTYIGFISDKEYDTYYHEAVLSSTVTSDNDTISFVIAFVKDSNGKEHTLSLVRAPNDHLAGSKHYAIIYNFQQSDAVVIADGSSGVTVKASGTGENWNGRAVKVYVKRDQNIITVGTTEIGNTTTYVSTVLTTNLATNPNLTRFLGPKPYGYGCYSTQDATFSNIRFIPSVSSIYNLNDNKVYDLNTTNYTYQPNPSKSINDLEKGRLYYSNTTNVLFYNDPDSTMYPITESTKGRTAKAWVNFNGTFVGGITARSSYNIASITREATGTYLLTFIEPMTDINYVMCGSAASLVAEPTNDGGQLAITLGYSNAQTKTSVRIRCGRGGTLVDSHIITVAIFGN